jgi:hypothetical protein
MKTFIACVLLTAFFILSVIMGAAFPAVLFFMATIGCALAKAYESPDRRDSSPVKPIWIDDTAWMCGDKDCRKFNVWSRNFCTNCQRMRSDAHEDPASIVFRQYSGWAGQGRGIYQDNDFAMPLA